MRSMSLGELLAEVFGDSSGGRPGVRTTNMDDLERQVKEDPELAKKNAVNLAKMHDAANEIRGVLEKFFPYPEGPAGQLTREVAEQSMDNFNHHVSAMVNTLAMLYGREAALFSDSILDAVGPIAGILDKAARHNQRVDELAIGVLHSLGQITKETSFKEVRRRLDEHQEKNFERDYGWIRKPLDSSTEAHQRSGCDEGAEGHDHKPEPEGGATLG